MHSLALNGVVVIGLGLMLVSAPFAAMEEGRGSEGKQHLQGEESSGGDMKSRRAQIRARMEERQSKLDDLAARMNQASGPEKIEAMAALLNEMVDQRKALRDRIADRMTSQKGEGGYEGGESASKMPDKGRDAR